MNSMSWRFATHVERARAKEEVLSDHRTRVAAEAEARAYRRQLDLAEQYSDFHPPEVRIATWEKLHELRMPSDPQHPVLDVIAIQTRLRLLDVHAVQAARKQRVPETT